MIYRTLGQTGLKVSLLGFGTAGLCKQYYPDKPPPSEKDAIKLIHRALELGVNYFDTAPTYESERLLGLAIKEFPPSLALNPVEPPEPIIATKVKIPDDCPRGHEVGFIRASLEESHKRLDYKVRIVQIHNPTPDQVVNSPVVDAMQFLKEKGWLDHAGISVASPYQKDEYVINRAFSHWCYGKRGLWEVYQAPWNFNAPFLESTLKRIVCRRGGLVVRQPFDKGGLKPDCLLSPLYSLSIDKKKLSDIPILLVGMTTIEELEQNVEIINSLKEEA